MTSTTIQSEYKDTRPLQNETGLQMKIGEDQCKVIRFKHNMTKRPGVLFLSNLYTFEPIDYKGFHIRSSEAAFQGSKAIALGMPDDVTRSIFESGDGLTAKKKGGQGAMVNALLESSDINDWFDKNNDSKEKKISKASLTRLLKAKYKSTITTTMSDEWMRSALTAKFNNKELKRQLLNTGNSILAESNGRSRSRWTESYGNVLGKMLMEIRNKI